MTETTTNHDKAITTHLLNRMGLLSDEIDWLLDIPVKRKGFDAIH